MNLFPPQAVGHLSIGDKDSESQGKPWGTRASRPWLAWVSAFAGMTGGSWDDRRGLQ